MHFNIDFTELQRPSEGLTLSVRNPSVWNLTKLCYSVHPRNDVCPRCVLHSISYTGRDKLHLPYSVCESDSSLMTFTACSDKSFWLHTLVHHRHQHAALGLGSERCCVSNRQLSLFSLTVNTSIMQHLFVSAPRCWRWQVILTHLAATTQWGLCSGSCGALFV